MANPRPISNSCTSIVDVTSPVTSGTAPATFSSLQFTLIL